MDIPGLYRGFLLSLGWIDHLGNSAPPLRHAFTGAALQRLKRCKRSSCVVCFALHGNEYGSPCQQNKRSASCASDGKCRRWRSHCQVAEQVSATPLWMEILFWLPPAVGENWGIPVDVIVLPIFAVRQQIYYRHRRDGWRRLTLLKPWQRFQNGRIPRRSHGMPMKKKA